MFWSPVLDGADEELIRQRYHLRFAIKIDDLKSAGRRPLLNRAHVDGVILLGNEKGRVKEMLVYEAVDSTLKALGVDTVFGVMGDGNMRFVTHMTQECGITYYAARHESAAAGMGT